MSDNQPKQTTQAKREIKRYLMEVARVQKPPESTTESDCPSCKGQPEPGWIAMPNNGPFVPCWLCNRETWRKWLEDSEVFP